MRLLLAWVVLAGLCGSALADDAKATARAHLDAGTKFFNIQQYDKAADEYQQAYLLDPDPAYLYAVAQAQRLGGDCEKALLSYQAYLRTNPTDPSKAQKNIERCQQDLANHTVTHETMIQAPVIEAPVIPAPQPPGGPAAPEMVAEPWSGDWVGHVLVGGGVLAAAGGAYFFMAGRSAISDNNGAATYDQFASAHGGLGNAHTKEVIGVSAMAAGGALLVGGVLHYYLHTRPEPVEHLTAAVGPQGATLVFSGAF